MKERIANVTKSVLENAQMINGVKVTRLRGPRIPDVVKNVAFGIKAASPESTVFVGATQDGGKPMLTLMISEDLVKTGLNAGQIVREAAKLIQGGGGGQPFFAQAGGKNVEGLSAAEDKMMQLLGLK